MNGKGNHFFLVLLLVCLVPVGASAESEDLQSLYVRARQRDPATGKAQARLDASKADSGISLSQMLPRISATAAINRISSETVNYTPKTITSAYTGNNYGFNTRVPLFNAPTIYNLAASRAGIRGADAVLTGSRQELIVTLAEAYFALLKAQVDEVLYRDEMKRLGQIYEQVSEFQKSGTGSGISVLEAKAKLDSAASDHIKAIMMSKLASQQLESIVGYQVHDIKDLGSYTPHGPESANYEWWYDTMLKNRPSLVQAREALAQTELQRKAMDAGHLPTISASGGYSFNKGSTFIPRVETSQWLIGVDISVPIYSGGETTARTQKALALESEQSFALSEAREVGVQKLKQAFLNMEFSSAIIPSLLQKRASARMQLEATREGQRVGTRTGIDLLNAEQGFAIAQRDLAGASYDNALRHLQLKAATGILTENDLAELNQLLVTVPAREHFLLR
ncbi:MAG TPA: TolC family protein [Desulfuromonadales bacterium]|nr:TolC family protein [Desulfuromonadales bacterium]